MIIKNRKKYVVRQRSICVYNFTDFKIIIDGVKIMYEIFTTKNPHTIK